MKNVLKRLTALLLSVLMVTGLFADCLPAALAAGESASLPKSATTEVNPADPAAGRPRLYVDFLGDNGAYNPAGTTAPGGIPVKPSDRNYQGTGKWNQYVQGGTYDGKTIFWVGIGVDRMNVLDLFKDWQSGDGNKGITTLETAFYYNSKFIEPYTGALPGDTEAVVNEKFKTVLGRANLASGDLQTANTSWNADYEILSASTGCAPQQEVVTQEVIADPGMAEIMAAGTEQNPNPWKMSYFSLSKTKSGQQNRFQNDWTGVFNATDETKNLPTQYLAVVPFVLKAYDTTKALPLRLSRNAELFTIGGGDTGSVRYGAWESTTTRTPRKDIKLMTDFMGDLNIFTGEKAKGPDRKATLELIGKVSDLLTAELGVTNATGTAPRSITESGQFLYPLAGGTGLELKVHCPTGYSAEVTFKSTNTTVVVTDGGMTVTPNPPATVADFVVTKTAGSLAGDAVYRFVLPNSDASVSVKFIITGATNFKVSLVDTINGASVALADLPSGNKTQIDTKIAVVGQDGKPVTPAVPDVDGQVHSFSTDAAGVLLSPKSVQARQGTAVKITVWANANYTATVKLTTYLGSAITPSSATDLSGKPLTVNTAGTVLPYGGIITLNLMPQEDIIATVTYTKANIATAHLEVWHEDQTKRDVNTLNSAQLAGAVADETNVFAPIYSDVVYQNISGTAYPASAIDGDHHAVKMPFQILDKVNGSEALDSLALGGDGGRTPSLTWSGSPNGLMAKVCMIYSDAAISALDDKAKALAALVTPDDLKGFGIYKNDYKEPFCDGDKIDFARTLLELVARCTLATDTTEQNYLVKVPATTGTPIVPEYTYLNLTQGQVQAYLTDRLIAAESYRKNSTAYTALLAEYDRTVFAYNAAVAAGKTATLLGKPAAPQGDTLDPATCVRTATPATYQNAGYFNDYKTYAEAWRNYYTTLAGGTATPPTAPLPTPLAAEKLAIRGVNDSPPFTAKPLPTAAQTPDSAALKVRTDSDVTLTLESNSTYTVTKIELLKQAGRTIITTLDLEAARYQGHRNVYRFTMPAADCVVKVTYGPRILGDLKLSTNGKNGNEVSVIAHGAADAGGTAETDRPSQVLRDMTADGSAYRRVLAGSLVTAKVRCKAGYSWSATAIPKKNGVTQPGLPITGGSGSADGGFTFRMPSEAGNEVTIRVTYTSTTKSSYDAYLVNENGPVGAAVQWPNGATKNPSILEGIAITGTITVPAKSYIRSVTALTGTTSNGDFHQVMTTGSIPYTLSGNGYNNGGGGTATVSIVMPPAHTYILVEFGTGVPPEEPDQRLTLQVVDRENGGPNYASNTAVAVTNTAPAPLRLTAGKRTADATAPTPAELYDFGYAHAGDTVRLTLNPDAGYYTSLLVVGPQGTGVTPVWTGTTSAEFIMPAGDASVTVTFQKKPGKYPDENWLYLSKKETPAVTLTNGNQVPFVYSETLKSVLPENTGHYQNGTMAAGNYHKVPGDANYSIARQGETVTLYCSVEPGFYLHSLTVLDTGAALPYTIADNGGDSGTDANGYNGGQGAKAVATYGVPASGIIGITGGVKVTFQMPAGHVHVTAHYHQGDPANDKVHSLGLRVLDPENVDPVSIQNTATLTAIGSAPGSTVATVGPLEKDGFASEHVRFGDRVSIDWTAASGYGLDVVEVTPAGEVPVPTVIKTETSVAGVTTGTATFTMPDRDAVVEVRFKAGAAKAYTANLVLRMPEGSPVNLTMADVGSGTFTAPIVGTMERPIYSVSGAAGTKVNLALFAKDGYYIRAVTVTPADHNATETVHLSGTFGTQTASFALPAASPSTVNVFFGKGYPGEVHYPLTLKVTDGDKTASGLNNEAHFGDPFTAPEDTAPVLGGQQKTVTPGLLDGATANVTVKPLAGYTADITAQNAAGQSVPCYATGTGVSFRISDSPVTVSVVFRKELPADRYNIALITTLVDSTTAAGAPGATMSLTGGGAPMTISGGQGTLANVPKGAPVQFTVTPNAGTLVTKAYAVDKLGRQLILPPSQVTAGGTVTFGMPNTDATVYLELDDTPHAADQFPATLTLMGPENAKTIATMAAAGGTPTITVTTGFTDSSKTLFAAQETLMTVTVGPGDGVNPPFFAGIQITDKNGADIPYQTAQGELKFTYKLPHGGAKVTVFLFGFPDDGGGSILGDQYMTQIISNKDSFPDVGLDATINTSGTPSYSVITEYGQVLNIHLTLQTGYRVESIAVIPAFYGLVPTLGKPSTVSQDTSIVLPGDNMIVSVSFARDEIARKKATLSLTWPGTTAVPIPLEQEATLHSAVTGTKKIATIPGTESVQGGVGELVTAIYPLEIELSKSSFCSADSVTVKRADGSPVPFTQVSPKEVTFPMVDSDATVTVAYEPLGSTEPGLNELPAVLHVVDLSTGSTIETAAQAYGQLVYGANNTGTIAPLPEPGGTATIQVPAGDQVTLNTFTDASTYVQAAYAIYQEGGQMIKCDLPAFTTGAQTASFAMHSGRVDVYVYVNTAANTHHSAVLKVVSSDATDTTSNAYLSATNTVPGVTAIAGGAHKHLPVGAGEKVTVAVTPKEGAAVELVLVTPLGITLTKYTQVANTITFTMPTGQNVMVLVKLKAKTTAEYNATFHLAYQDKDGNAITGNLPAQTGGAISYQVGSVTTSATTDGAVIAVPEGQAVTLAVTLTDLPGAADSWKVLAAYVMKGGDLVPLAPQLEGTGDTKSDALVPDKTAQFTMPAGNTDVYLVLTQKALTDTWSTAVLVATDKEGADVNTGKNSVTLTANGVTKTAVSSGAPGSVWVTVPQNGQVAFQTKTIGTGFQFDPPPGLTAQSGTPPTVSGTPVGGYHYTAPNVGGVPVNTAIHMKFSSATTTGHNLTVRIEDSDNESAADHVVTVTAGAAAPLKLHSVTPSGAIQMIPAVSPLDPISGTVTGTAGYSVFATLSYPSGGSTVTADVPLTPNPDGTYRFDGLTMPNSAATLTVVFYKPYTVALVLEDRGTNPNSVVTLKNSATAVILERKSIHNGTPITETLPTGTVLTITPTVPTGSRLQGIFATTTDGTVTLTAQTDGTYRYTVDGKNVTLRAVVVGETDVNPVATISAVSPGLLAESEMPTLSVSGQTEPFTAQVTAAAGTEITAHITVPAGGTVTLTRSDNVIITGDVIDNSEGLIPIFRTATFIMPAANVHITATYTQKDPGGGVDPPHEDLTAYTKMVNVDNVVGNAITEIKNLTVSMPSSSPHWVRGRPKDTIRVSFTAAQGYSAVVTAKTGKPADTTGTPVPVIQQGFTRAGYAELQMPESQILNASVTFTVTYSKDFIPEKKDLTLQLVGHENLAENVATLSVAGGSLNLDGSMSAGLDPISKTLTAGALPGESITFDGGWKAGYQISKAELVIGTAPSETVTLIDLNRYGLKATAMMKMPNDNAILRVTFAPSYKNTLTIFGSIPGDAVSMETAGKPPVTQNNGAIENLQGGETVTTTVTPAGTQKVIGVVRTTATGGAVNLATATPPEIAVKAYTDTMPKEDAVTAVVLGPTASTAHIAKVVYHADSVGQTQPGNGVTIQNISNPAAAAGTLWVAAEGGNVVELTVSLAAGYQALIMSVTKDLGGNIIYVNRTSFLTSGTKGSFTMPADSDATVTIKFIQGYQATLNLNDAAGAPNIATMKRTADTITATSDAAGAVTYSSSISGVPSPDTLYGLPTGAPLDISTTTVGQNSTIAPYWITQTTALTGTKTLESSISVGADGNVSTAVAGENTTVSVILRDPASSFNILASVLLGGSSDIVGNGVNANGTPAVGISENATEITPRALGGAQSGRIWTTTASEHYIAVTMTVAQGYAAIVQVTAGGTPLTSTTANPFKLYTKGNAAPTTLADGVGAVPVPYDPAGAGDAVGQEKIFVFRAPANMTPGSEIVVTVVYEAAASIPRPYDPRNAVAATLDMGYILTENHGDYGIVDIPALYDGANYFDTDQHSTDPTSKVTFEFALSGATAGSYVLLTGTEVSITELINYDYATGGTLATTRGSKFRLNLLPGASEALKKIFNNDGTTGVLDHQLFVRSKDNAGRMSEYTQVSVPKAYFLSGYVEGFAPNHETVLTLYPLSPEGVPGKDPKYDRNPDHYDLTAPIVNVIRDPMEDPGFDGWRQSFDIMSSALLGDGPSPTAKTYMLTVERGGNLTYTRVALVLDPADTDPATGHYNVATQTFRLADVIALRAGDVNGDGAVKAQDEFALMNYLQNPDRYTTKKAPGPDPATDTDWKRSIYNPDTEVYRSDLNGNRRVEWDDWYKLFRNQNATPEVYNWKISLAGEMALPFGLDGYVAPTRGAVGPMADLPPEGEIPEEVPGPEGPPTEEQVPETPENPTPETPPADGEVILPEPPADSGEMPALPPDPEEDQTPNQEPDPNLPPPLGPQKPDKRPNPKPAPPSPPPGKA